MPQYLFNKRGTVLRWIAERVRNAGELYLFLDYDGTLVRIRKTPPQAVLAPRARTFLRRLNSLGGTTFGVITGRSLRDIRTLLRLSDVVLAANHGFEILIGSRRWTHPEVRRLRPRFAALTTELRRRLRRIPRLLVENKGSTLSVHYRNVPVSRIAAVREIIRSVTHPYRRSIAVTAGKKVVEIRPRVPWGKGHALRRILKSQGKSRDRLVIYCGDDVTDEDAFRLLPHDAVTVRVGKSRGTEARFYVRNVPEIYRFLALVARVRMGADR